MRNKVEFLVGDVSLLIKERNSNWCAFSEEKILQASNAYIHLGMYANAGDALANWLKYRESEKVTEALNKLKDRVYLSEVKCKVIKVVEDSELGHFGNTKYKTLEVVIDRYDTHGNVIEHIEKSGHKIDEYWRREYVYYNSDNPDFYTEYDKDGNETKHYSAILDSSGKISSDTLTEGNKETKTTYSYTFDGLLERKEQTVNGKNEDRYFYTYDDLDRVVDVTRLCGSEYENWKTIYRRKSNRLMRDYSKGNGIVTNERVWLDFMGKPLVVYRFIRRSDAGWIHSGIQYEYTNKYSLK